jgi:hypothetical protein
MLHKYSNIVFTTNHCRYFILLKVCRKCWIWLKPLDTFGKQYCPRSTLRVSQLLYKITNLWKCRLNWSSESGENNGKTHPCFRTFRRVMKSVNSISWIDIVYCWITFQEKSFTITVCKPCKLFVNLWTFFFFSVLKVSNGFKPSVNTIQCFY